MAWVEKDQNYYTYNTTTGGEQDSSTCILYRIGNWKVLFMTYRIGEFSISVYQEEGNAVTLAFVAIFLSLPIP